MTRRSNNSRVTPPGQKRVELARIFDGSRPPTNCSYWWWSVADQRWNHREHD